MAVYVITGKLGAGKTLGAVGRARDYLNQNRRVATNLDLRLENLINSRARNTECFRLPDIPTIEDLEALGMGSDKFGEEHFGAIILDECGFWLNTREFQDKNRKRLMEWFLYSRHRRWDVYFIIQNINALDKQFRDMLAEHVVTVQRLDRFKIPLVSWLLEFVGISVTFPKMHVATVRYGSGAQAFIVDRWVYMGRSLYDAFNTEQGVSSTRPDAISQYLPPWHVRGRYETPWQETKRKAKAFFATFRLKTAHFFLAGLLGGVVLSSRAGSVFNHHAATVASVSPSSLTQPPASQADTDIWSGVHITGTLAGPHVTEIFYADSNGRSFDPSRLGYRDKMLSPCYAMVINDKTGDVRYLHCSPTDDVGGEPAAAGGELGSPDVTTTPKLPVNSPFSLASN